MIQCNTVWFVGNDSMQNKIIKKPNQYSVFSIGNKNAFEIIYNHIFYFPYDFFDNNEKVISSYVVDNKT